MKKDRIVSVRLTEAEYEVLRSRGNVSAALRDLIPEPPDNGEPMEVGSSGRGGIYEFSRGFAAIYVTGSRPTLHASLACCQGHPTPEGAAEHGRLRFAAELDADVRAWREDRRVAG